MRTEECAQTLGGACLIVERATMVMLWETFKATVAYELHAIAGSSSAKEANRAGWTFDCPIFPIFPAVTIKLSTFQIITNQKPIYDLYWLPNILIKIWHTIQIIP